MVESEVDEYNLNANERKQSLKISLINNQQIAMTLINIDTQQIYSALVSLPQLKNLCKGFISVNNIKDALIIIKNTIESGNVLLGLDPNGNSIEINYRILLNKREYPLNIDLLLTNNGNSNNLNHYRSNSAAKGKSMYSTRTADNNNIMEMNQFNNAGQNNQNINQVNNLLNNNPYNNMNFKINSDYSTMSVQNRPFVMSNLNYGLQGPNPTLKNNNLNTAIIFENRPRMINQKDPNRSSSTPSHQDFKKFNSNQSQNIYQPNQTNNPFQVNLSFNQKLMNNNPNMKFPFDRNTEKPIVKNSYVLNMRQDPQDKTSLNKQNQIKGYKTQTLESKTKQKKKNVKSKNVKNPQLKQQSSLGKPPQQIKQTQSYTNKRMDANQQLGHQYSHDLNQKNQMFSKPQNTQFRSKISTPIPDKTLSLSQKQNLYNNNQISQQQIALAQLASMQNQENPNLKNIEAITLQGKEEFQITMPQSLPPQQYEEEEEREEEEEIQEPEKEPEQEPEQEQEQQVQDELNIEALFITEEGRVIFRNGLLRGIIHKYAEIDDVVSKIQDILLKGAKFHLVYKAFDLDDKAKTFHDKCDNLNMSLVLVETDKDVRFGGFTTKSWKGNCLKKKDNYAFVFNLNTNKIFDIIPNEPAIGCYPKFGPVFFGCQIRIYDEFFSKGGSTCHRGLNYKTRKDFELNNGEQKYLVKDIEVYNIETIDID